MRGLTVIAAAAVFCAVAPRSGEAEPSWGFGLAPALPSLQPVTAAEMASGLLGGLAGDRDGTPLQTPLAVADALRNAKCVVFLNHVSGTGGTGSIRQTVDVGRFVMNCR
jgi:hypothetical protein